MAYDGGLAAGNQFTPQDWKWVPRLCHMKECEMPMYDYQGECGCRAIDVLEPIVVPTRLCAEHGAVMKRAWLTKLPAVHSDSIRGGILIRNGLCNEDRTPRRFDSKSEIKRAAKQKKLQNVTEHIGDAHNGSDKAPSVGGGKTTTSRWI